MNLARPRFSSASMVSHSSGEPDWSARSVIGPSMGRWVPCRFRMNTAPTHLFRDKVRLLRGGGFEGFPALIDGGELGVDRFEAGLRLGDLFPGLTEEGGVGHRGVQALLLFLESVDAIGEGL